MVAEGGPFFFECHVSKVFDVRIVCEEGGEFFPIFFAGFFVIYDSTAGAAFDELGIVELCAIRECVPCDLGD